MKLLSPTIPLKLEAVDDAPALFAADDSISEVSLEHQTLTGYTSKSVTLRDSLVTKSDLSAMICERFDIFNCQFSAVNLATTKLPNSSWHVVAVHGARCSGMQVSNSTLRNVVFKDSKLDMVNFRFSKLENVRFEDCMMDDVDFYSAQLKNVEFVNCQINNITFASARMKSVDLSRSHIELIKGAGSLKGATISYDQLMQLAPYFAAEAGIKVA